MKSSTSPSRLNPFRSPILLSLGVCLLAIASASADPPGSPNGNGPPGNGNGNPPGGTHSVPEGGLGLLGCGVLVAGLAVVQLRKGSASKRSA